MKGDFTMNQQRSKEELREGGVTLLGNTNTKYPTDYFPEILETFQNKNPENDYVVSFDAYELTCLCPLTHQPDFAKVVISYIPNERMVESKSLKLYLFSFRNHGDFHEDTCNIIMKDLVELMNPKYIEVKCIYSPRGGISIFPFCNWCNPEFPEFKEFEHSRKVDALRDASNRTVKYDM